MVVIDRITWSPCAGQRGRLLRNAHAGSRTPAVHRVLSPVSSTMSSAFPKGRMGRLPACFVPRITTSRRSVFRGCRYSLMFRPPSLLSPQIVPTAANTAAGQPGILRPGLSCFVASTRTGYANRLTQAIDGTGTFTLSDSQPCRLLTSLHRHYPASAVLRTSPSPQGARPVPRGLPVGRRRPRFGASRVSYAFLVYMLPPLPRRSVWAYCFAHFAQPCQPSPKGSSGRPAHRPFRGLLVVHAPCGLQTRAVPVYRDTLSEDLRP